MRILAIRGCNLASLEGEFDIDFTVEPLKSAGIFAITGSTGSGKSTILDAVCLALFNDTPRLNRAGNRDNIVDIKDITVSLGDSRNILRRGTASGYAEVDFVALSGDSYRSRWSVRRSRDKASGSLQPWNLTLENLTTGEVQQGGKSELLTKMKELIGLSFDQFTRAVMLAQGDFATFLKADKKEKADILEKLTGTDIYSRISVNIYNKTQDAKSAFELVQRQIEGVELLDDVNLSEIEAEEKLLATVTKELEQSEKNITEKRKWIDVNNQLLDTIESAEETLNRSNEELNKAKPRFEYLAKLDSVQEIRDDFKSLEHTQAQLGDAKITLDNNQQEQRVNKEGLTKSKIELDKAIKKQSDIDNEWLVLQPLLKKARETDTQIVGSQKIYDHAEAELLEVEEQKGTTNKNIESISTSIEQSKNQQKTITTWFDTNSSYSEIVSKTELILSFIKDATTSKKSSEGNEKQIKRVEIQLTKDREKSEEYKKEAERLNNLLPTEIAELRAKLANGEPCPVCGSLHHPISSIEVDTLAEEELNIAKVDIASRIKTAETSIKEQETNIISLNTIVEGFKIQYKSACENLATYLQSFQYWNELFDDGTLSEVLSTKSKEWQDNEQYQRTLQSSIELKKQELKITKDRLTEIDKSLSEKNTKRNNAQNELLELKTLRTKLLNGVSADIVEGEFSTRKDEVKDRFDKATSDNNNFITKEKELEGAISQIRDNIKRLEEQEIVLSKSVDVWIVSRENNLTKEELIELLSKDNVWLSTERRELDELKKATSTSETLLKERKDNHQNHQKAEIKPIEEDCKESLTELLNTTITELTSKKERQIEVTVLLANHKNGKERIKSFENELKERGEVANNWQKLNELFGSADGAKFKTIAQGYTLDVLLGYANKHLSEISDRYLLERVSPESLALQVQDLDMLAEVRSIHSLSGGESFLISLALALGLSSLSSSRMSVESLFIDEGFGTLDAETLRVTMDVLERLQTQGRKIGVISHVAEMTERITTQIRVVKTTNGRSNIEII